MVESTASFIFTTLLPMRSSVNGFRCFRAPSRIEQMQHEVVGVDDAFLVDVIVKSAAENKNDLLMESLWSQQPRVIAFASLQRRRPLAHILGNVVELRAFVFLRCSVLLAVFA